MEPIQEKRTVFSTDVLQNRIKDLGAEISQDYKDKELIMVGVLKGSLYFYADLTRALTIPVGIDFISIGTIPETTKQTGIVRINKDLDINITGKHVLIIEDIIRTGLTTAYLVQSLDARKPASIQICSLLLNPHQQLINLPIAYNGFEVDNAWLMGYGMDVGEYGRNLPYIVEIDK